MDKLHGIKSYGYYALYDDEHGMFVVGDHLSEKGRWAKVDRNGQLLPLWWVSGNEDFLELVQWVN